MSSSHDGPCWVVVDDRARPDPEDPSGFDDTSPLVDWPAALLDTCGCGTDYGDHPVNWPKMSGPNGWAKVNLSCGPVRRYEYVLHAPPCAASGCCSGDYEFVNVVEVVLPVAR